MTLISSCNHFHHLDLIPRSQCNVKVKLHDFISHKVLIQSFCWLKRYSIQFIDMLVERELQKMSIIVDPEKVYSSIFLMDTGKKNSALRNKLNVDIFLDAGWQARYFMFSKITPLGSYAFRPGLVTLSHCQTHRRVLRVWKRKKKEWCLTS